MNLCETPPQADTTPPRQTPPSRHPSGRHTYWPDTSRADTPSPQQMATVAYGTHPTGMHSCYEFVFGQIQEGLISVIIFQIFSTNILNTNFCYRFSFYTEP